MTITRGKVVAYITHTDPDTGTLRLLVLSPELTVERVYLRGTELETDEMGDL